MKGFLEYVGCAVCILAVCLGPPSCSYILAKRDALMMETEARFKPSTNTVINIEKKP